MEETENILRERIETLEHKIKNYAMLVGWLQGRLQIAKDWDSATESLEIFDKIANNHPDPFADISR